MMNVGLMVSKIKAHPVPSLCVIINQMFVTNLEKVQLETPRWVLYRILREKMYSLSEQRITIGEI